MIGLIVCKDKAGKSIAKGVAAMVSPSFLVTAASNIISKD
jgi:hypothetical protein